jgi:hypothetical protein
MTEIELPISKSNEIEQKPFTNIANTQVATKTKGNALKAFNKDNCFTLKKWNLVAMWSWDVECEVCAICRTALMGYYSTLLKLCGSFFKQK